MSECLRIALIVAAALLAACGNDSSPGAPGAEGGEGQREFRWKMVTTWPPNFPVLQEGAEKFAEDVGVMSGGRLQIHVFAAGELVPALQVFDAVSQGSVEMGHGAAYYWAGKVPAAQFLSTVPFGMTAKGVNAWLYAGGGLELWHELYAPFGVRPFPAGNTGMQMGGWFNKRIESVGDLKGLKMRIPGLGGNVFAKAGGNPVLMAGGEIYTALERGTIDATEWISPYHDQRLGLDRAASYYYYPGWHEPGTALELIVNDGAWSALPPSLQRTVEVAAMAINLWIYAQLEVRNQEALAQLRSNERVSILRFPDDVLRELSRLTREALDADAASDPDFKRVYDAYRAFNKSNREWSSISEDAYQEFLRAEGGSR